MSSNVGASCSLPPAEIAKLRMEQRKARRAEAQHKFREQRKALDAPQRSVDVGRRTPSFGLGKPCANGNVEIGESLNSSTCPKSTQEQAESSRPSKRGVDVAVETPRISDENLCKSSQASIVPIRIHRWTETKPLVHFLVLKLQKKV
ncbi:hypothetical protein MRX96_043305 [Rhipicephalus microplus]